MQHHVGFSSDGSSIRGMGECVLITEHSSRSQPPRPEAYWLDGRYPTFRRSVLRSVLAEEQIVPHAGRMLGEMCFVDLEKAFGHVPLDILVGIL